MSYTQPVPIPNAAFTLAPQNSFLDYHAAVESWQFTEASVQKPLGDPTQQSRGQNSTAAGTTLVPLAQSASGLTTTDGYKMVPLQGRVPQAIVQYARAGTTFFRLSGHAVRIGYRIAPPRLVDCAGQTPVLLSRYVKEEQVGNSGGVPIYGLVWELDYIIPLSPDGGVPPIAPNPILNGNPNPQAIN